MCGIIGILNKNKTPVNYTILSQMASTINHRGPDADGHFIDSNVGFFHKRLSIIDLVTGNQPMTSNGNTIVYNGEIYNYVELRENLKKKGYYFQTNSDTEVILKSYEEYGFNCVKYLNGMFAFLIFDKKKNKLFAARDHFGIKPLYYYFDDSYIIFASEIKAILHHPDVETKPNYSAIHEYLTFQFLLNNSTLFEKVNKIKPAHYLVVDLKTMQIQSQSYWEPCFKIDVNTDEKQFTTQLYNLLEDAIKIQMRSDVPLGTYLSGGLDSSIVTTIASKYSTQKLKCFTGAFKEGNEFNETSFAQEVVALCGSELFKIFPSEYEFVDLLPNLIYFMDEPVAGPGLFPQYMVSQLASKQVKVVLGGQGGDEIYGGYARYVIAYIEQSIKCAIFENNEEDEHVVSLKSILPNLPYLKQYIPMIREFWQKGAFDFMDKRYFQLIDRSPPEEYFEKEFLLAFDKDAVFNNFKTLFNHPDTFSYYNKMTHFDLFGSLPALLQVEDRMSMASSIESRVPLLDHRLVDIMAMMPAAMKFKGAEMKYILKRVVKNIIPSSVYNRKDKMGFPVPLHIWINKKPVNKFVKDVLLSNASKNRGILNNKSLEKLLSSERKFGRQLWGFLCLELWFQQFIDKKLKIKQDTKNAILNK